MLLVFLTQQLKGKTPIIADKCTPLTYAIRKANIAVVKEILKHEVDPDTRELESGLSALHVAVEVGNIEAIRCLAQVGADLNARNREGNTPLSVAVRKSKYDIVELLLSLGANPNVGGGEWHPFVYLIKNNELKMMQFLKERFSHNVLIKEAFRTLLINAIEMEGDHRVINMLFECCEYDTNIRDQHGKTLLHLVMGARSFNPGFFSMLVKRGADVTAQDKYGNTLLCEAVMSRDNVRVKWLVESYSPDINESNFQRESPLILAVKMQDLYSFPSPIIDFLLSNGANVNALDANGDSPLCIAVRNNLLNLITKLLSCKADVNFKTRTGETLLHVAVSPDRYKSGALFGLHDAFNLLFPHLRHRVNDVDCWGRTILFIASNNDDNVLVRKLSELPEIQLDVLPERFFIQTTNPTRVLEWTQRGGTISPHLREDKLPEVLFNAITGSWSLARHLSFAPRCNPLIKTVFLCVKRCQTRGTLPKVPLYVWVGDVWRKMPISAFSVPPE